MEHNFTNISIERCDKESEEVIAKEGPSFLSSPLKHLKQYQNEFVYLESPTFEQVKIDAISLELDDVFKTYMALLGLKVQKKHTHTIKTYLNDHLVGDDVNYSGSFSNEDGLWELNIPINFMEGYTEEMTIGEAITITIRFLQDLLSTID